MAGNVRRGALRRGVPEASAPDLVDSAAADPREAAEQAEAGRLLVEIVACLTEEQREVFLLVEIEEMPVPEAADALGINPNTCYSRLRAARSRFERELEARCRREEGDGT